MGLQNLEGPACQVRWVRFPHDPANTTIQAPDIITVSLGLNAIFSGNPGERIDETQLMNLPLAFY